MLPVDGLISSKPFRSNHIGMEGLFTLSFLRRDGTQRAQRDGTQRAQKDGTQRAQGTKSMLLINYSLCSLRETNPYPFQRVSGTRSAQALRV